MDVAHQVCIIYAVVNGYLNGIDISRIAAYEQRLYEHLENQHSDLMELIRITGKLEKGSESSLKVALNELKAEFSSVD